jgi:thiosulfate reductase / polysulfide reductase chain A
MSKNQMNRRRFLKLTSTGIVSTIVLNEFTPLFAEMKSSGKNVSLLTKNLRKGIPSFCNLCPAQCGIIGFVDRKNWLAGIQGNPHHPNNRGKICSRGIAGMNLVHDPERQLSPLKRIGKRGSGKWKKISWEKALSEVSSKLNQSRNNGKSSQIVFNAEDRYLTGLNRKFIKALGNPTIVPSTNFSDRNKSYAQNLTWGENYEIPDIENSDYILMFGVNPFESHPFFVSISQRIVEARMNNGAKLVTIDPRMSNTAGRSDEWLPIKPGTDGIVALAMANVIMQENLHDRNFLNNWTNISTVELRKYLSQFAPEKAEKISTMPAEKIKDIAKEFASKNFSVAISGSGISKRSNGVQNERCVLLLNAIVGNIDKKGGFCLPRKFEIEDFVSDPNLQFESIEFYDKLVNDKIKIDSFISVLSNPAYETPKSEQVTDTLKDENKVPFLLVIDHVMSETAMLADIFLPASTHLEGWDVSFAASFDFVPQVTLAQPVIPALGDSLPLHDIWLGLAKKIGGEVAQDLNYEDAEQYFYDVTSQIPGFSSNSDFKKLKEQGTWISDSKKEFDIYRRKGFQTSTGKFEINLYRMGKSALPDYVDNKNELNKHQFYLIPFTTNVMPPDLANAKWLSEICHTNAALINPKTARNMRIHDGEKIILKSKNGKIELEVKTFQGIHPEAIAIRSGAGHSAFGGVAQAKKFKSADPDTSFLWWNKLGNGTNSNDVLELKVDTLGRGISRDTVVEIQHV